MKLDERKVYTVSEYINALNIGLKNFRLKMTGEISGHAYFSLKDENSDAIIGCIIWKSKYELFGIDLEDGMKMIVVGNSNIYVPDGRISFVADTVKLVSEGALKFHREKVFQE